MNPDDAMTTLALPALIALRALANLLEWFLKSILVFYFLFSQFPTKISTIFFPEICGLSGDFWSETAFSVL